MNINDILRRMGGRSHICSTGCIGMAVAYIVGDGGVSERCPDIDCKTCKGEALRRLADEIEAAAFAGLPRDANGEPVRLGDAVCTDEFGDGTVVAVSWKGSVCVRPPYAPSGKGGVWMRASETAHEPSPTSGDGVPLELGSRVWLEGIEHVVEGVRPTAAKVAGHWRDASELMAEPQEPEDTQWRITTDAARGSTAYWGCTGADCRCCPSMVGGEKPRDRYGTYSCIAAQTLDLLRRQRELDAKGAQR